MLWKYYNPKFEYERKIQGVGWPWAGHKNFAYDLVRNVKPKKIVELGTHYGTSFWSFCQAVKDGELDTELNAIDTWKGEKHSGFYGEEVFETVKQIKNEYYSKLKINLIRKTFDEALVDFEDKSVDILHIDGLHTYEAVKHDFENWFSKVKSDGIILLHDTFINRDDFGVYKFWEELKKNYATVEFFHSFGLGVVFKNPKKCEDIIGSQKDMQMKYSSKSEEMKYDEISSNLWRIQQKDAEIQQKDAEIQQKDAEIQQKDAEIQQKDAEIEVMKSSKFWKLREKYIWCKKVFSRFPLLLIKGIRVLVRYGVKEFFIRLKNLYKLPDEIQLGNRVNERIYLNDILNNFTSKPSGLPRLSLQKPIDIVIPVYNGLEHLPRLFRSLFENTTIPYRLIVIDDCSPDTRVYPFLMKVKKDNPEKSILLQKNDTNLGFVKTVNKAVSLTESDFVILNTDTEVPHGWLERLMHPIFKDKRIASTTPFTNAGTICSFPEIGKDNKIFLNLSVGEIDNYFRLVKAEKNLFELPTGVGFCMGINKKVVEKIGMFDEKLFNKGYGEENDWCQRAKRAGFKNIIVPNLFVYHKHGGSFSSKEKLRLQEENLKKLTKRYSNYLRDVNDFINRDPLKKIREFMVFLISANFSSEYKPILFIDHELGGGANFYRDEFIEKELSKGNGILLLTYKKNEDRYFLKYFYNNYKLEFLLKNYEDIEKILNFVQIKKIIINDLVSYKNPLKILSFIESIGKKFKIETEFMVHDYLCLCPNYVLLGSGGKFCNLSSDPTVCMNCMLEVKKNPNKFVENFDLDVDILEWRRNWKRFLGSVNRIICFSNSSRGMLEEIYPELINRNKITVRYHKVEYLEKIKEDFNLTIGILGGINYIKGLKIIKEILSLIEAENLKIRIVILGETSEEIKSRNLIVHGKYKREEIQKLTISYGIDLFLIPSIVPETFSYTTEEVIKMGYPVAVFNLGAPAERVRLYKKGIIIPKIDARSVLSAISKFNKKNKLKD